MAHAIAARTKASINRPLRPGDSGGSGGRCGERGALAEAAVVVTVTVTGVPELLGVTEVGETWQVVAVGAPLQDRLTAWLKPPMLVALKVYEAVPPGETVCDEEELVDTASAKF
jgi:hypothetical protein